MNINKNKKHLIRTAQEKKSAPKLSKDHFTFNAKFLVGTFLQPKESTNESFIKKSNNQNPDQNKPLSECKTDEAIDLKIKKVKKKTDTSHICVAKY